MIIQDTYNGWDKYYVKLFNIADIKDIPNSLQSLLIDSVKGHESVQLLLPEWANKEINDIIHHPMKLQYDGEIYNNAILINPIYSLSSTNKQISGFTIYILNSVYHKLNIIDIEKPVFCLRDKRERRIGGNIEYYIEMMKKPVFCCS